MRIKIKELTKKRDELNTLIFILSGGFDKDIIGDRKTVKELIYCYEDIGTEIQSLITDIIKDNGDDISPSAD